MEKIENMSSSYIYGVWDFLIFSMMVEYGNFFIALYFRVIIEEKDGPKVFPEMGGVQPEMEVLNLVLDPWWPFLEVFNFLHRST